MITILKNDTVKPESKSESPKALSPQFRCLFRPESLVASCASRFSSLATRLAFLLADIQVCDIRRLLDNGSRACIDWAVCVRDDARRAGFCAKTGFAGNPSQLPEECANDWGLDSRRLPKGGEHVVGSRGWRRGLTGSTPFPFASLSISRVVRRLRRGTTSASRCARVVRRVSVLRRRVGEHLESEDQVDPFAKRICGLVVVSCKTTKPLAELVTVGVCQERDIRGGEVLFI